MISTIRKLYLRISEPRAVRITFAGIYLCLVGSGGSALIQSPQSIANLFSPEFLVNGWAIFCFLGGAIGIGSVFSSYITVERIGTVLTAFGLMTYLTSILWIQFTSEPSGNRFPQAFVVTALIVAIIFRWIVISTTEARATGPINTQS